MRQDLKIMSSEYFWVHRFFDTTFTKGVSILVSSFPPLKWNLFLQEWKREKKPFFDWIWFSGRCFILFHSVWWTIELKIDRHSEQILKKPNFTFYWNKLKCPFAPLCFIEKLVVRFKSKLLINMVEVFHEAMLLVKTELPAAPPLWLALIKVLLM